MLKSGTEVSGYRIEGLLGYGGMGAVYEARQLSLDRVVALKILSEDLSGDISFRERFRREGQIQAAIDHPNIVTVYEAGEMEEGLFIAMRLIRGPTLKEMIIGRELEAARTLRILAPIADALDTAHAANLIHRDVKGQNILVGARDHSYLADFGLTKGMDESRKGLTKTGEFVGTIDYIAPEQIRGEPARAASDIYALSAVLYECLTGVVPYPKPSQAAVLFAHMSDPPPLVTEKRPELPPALNEVLVRGMAKDPADRYPTAGDLVQDAERAFGRRIRAAITPPGPVDSPEELGIREDEGKVPTRPRRLREAAELADAVVDETTPGAAPVARTQVPPPVDPTLAPAPVDPTVAPMPIDPTVAPGPIDPTVAPPPVDPTHMPPPADPTRAGAAAAAPPPAAATTARAPARPAERRRIPLVVPIAILAIGAIVAGFLVGNSGSDTSTAVPLASSASTADLGLSFPSAWTRADQPPSIPGLSFTRPITLREPGASGDELVAGIVDGSGRTLLPAAFLAALPKVPEPDDPVKLGTLSAYRYKELKPKDFNGTVTVYAVPTSLGVATVACYGPSSGTPPGEDCERIAGSLKLERGKAFALGPSHAYGQSLRLEITALNSARASGRKLLSAAKTPKAQAKAASSLDSAYTKAARALAALQLSPADASANVVVVAALRSTATGYRRMARAARRNRRAAYRAATRKVTAGESAVTKALKSLERLGYQVG